VVTPFPFLIPSHGLTFCFEVVNARDITIPQFITRIKDDIIQVARWEGCHSQWSILRFLWKWGKGRKFFQRFDRRRDVEDFRGVRLQRLRNEVAAQNRTILRHLNCWSKFGAQFGRIQRQSGFRRWISKMYAPFLVWLTGPRLVHFLHQSLVGLKMISPFRGRELTSWLIVWTRVYCSSFRRLTLIDYRYSALSTKSPDCSYIPRDITSPPALLQPQYNNTPFPTWVLEVAHGHESWKQLKNDARITAFSAQTSIQVLVGINFIVSISKYSGQMNSHWPRNEYPTDSAQVTHWPACGNHIPNSRQLHILGLCRDSKPSLSVMSIPACDPYLCDSGNCSVSFHRSRIIGWGMWDESFDVLSCLFFKSPSTASRFVSKSVDVSMVLGKSNCMMYPRQFYPPVVRSSQNLYRCCHWGFR